MNEHSRQDQRHEPRPVEVLGVDDFWSRVDAADHIVLMLDYDGTLAPFHVDRMQAVPLPNVLDALQRISVTDHTTVVLVSGRPVGELLILLGDHGLTIAGSHGYEWYTGTSGLVEMPVTPEQAAILDGAFAFAVSIFDPDRVERKVASVAVHFRGLDVQAYRDIETALMRDWQSRSSTTRTEVRPFNGGLELRAIGRSKGVVVHEVLSEFPAGTMGIYIGDDNTDEDAFAALPADGIGVKVGPSDVETHATGRLPDCGAVERLLIEWSTRTWQK
jgi:trehalose 6-phosphate phosphatase